MNPDRIILSGKGLTKSFGFGSNKTVAVDHVDFSFKEGDHARPGVYKREDFKGFN